MSMPRLTERLQVLIDEKRLARLKRQAEESGASVGALVRDAIDRTYPPVPPDRARAIDELLAMPPMPVDDWPVMEREIEETYDRSLPDQHESRT